MTRNRLIPGQRANECFQSSISPSVDSRVFLFAEDLRKKGEDEDNQTTIELIKNKQEIRETRETHKGALIEWHWSAQYFCKRFLSVANLIKIDKGSAQVKTLIQRN